MPGEGLTVPDVDTEPDFTTMVCLATSRKLSGRCVAGKVLGPGRWYRPISSRPDQAISFAERKYDGGAEPCLLDLVDVPFTTAQPSPFQPENWLFDADWYWQKSGELPFDELAGIQDRPQTLWGVGSSTMAGHNDRVPEARGRSESSLALIRVQDLVVRVRPTGQAFGNSERKVRGAFRYRDRDYDFTITDPPIEKRFLARGDGDYPVGDRFVTVSLAEPHNGFAYKLIAAVFDE